MVKSLTASWNRRRQRQTELRLSNGLQFQRRGDRVQFIAPYSETFAAQARQVGRWRWRSECWSIPLKVGPWEKFKELLCSHYQYEMTTEDQSKILSGEKVTILPKL